MAIVSIIIPTFNRAHLIAETLDSIKVQSFSGWECIIVDDGGTDDTPGLISKYTQADSRFKYFLRPGHVKKGANGCRNYGFEQSAGTYIKWFDSDDLMHPEMLQKQLRLLEAHPALDFCAAFSKIFAHTPADAVEDFNPIECDDRNALYHFIIGKLFFLTPAPMWRRSFLQDKVLFDANLHNAHETDFNFRMLAAGARFVYIRENLFYVRRGHQSITHDVENDSNTYQSYFDYFGKMYGHLAGADNRFDAVQTENLKNYTLFRRAVLFCTLVKINAMEFARKDLKILRRQMASAKMPLSSKLKFLIGLQLIWHFNKGYFLIYQKTFDLRR